MELLNNKNRTVKDQLKEIDSGIEQMLPALETIQHPMIKRVFAVRRTDDPERVYPLPPHLHARNISRLIASLKEWKQTCRVELSHSRKNRAGGRARDTVLDSAILTMGRFYYETTGKRPSAYRTTYKQGRFAGQFLDLVFETLSVLNAPNITENARNALGQRIERLMPDLDELLKARSA